MFISKRGYFHGTLVIVLRNQKYSFFKKIPRNQSINNSRNIHYEEQVKPNLGNIEFYKKWCL